MGRWHERQLAERAGTSDLQTGQVSTETTVADPDFTLIADILGTDLFDLPWNWIVRLWAVDWSRQTRPAGPDYFGFW